ncbi:MULTISPECIES: MFS transporter [Streptococcus]|uniref:Multidrug transporter n=1 Tax=Streptococcus thermophilus M17PTZA496 TaxID=1433289 RepID=A0A0E2Q3R6_STRTR|nr:MFS transporter [Streptococcus thermophilus]ETW91866.1 multidrug transporter [Streptococcus thermophilus M17PTZA496]EWM59843.1 multidrug transporter [Streptococcus thermophilus TH1477]MBW7797115.1 MFS transporter [Streptococcus thermophilus]MBW7802143.1 MFS transporter [Streptococcus thermophilus]MBW7821740.1 MFS transporter [Streptococcus thermophilus]
MFKKKNIIIFAMCLGVFLTLIDTTVMNIAMTSIQASLHTTLTGMNWALNIYSLLFAALAIPLGRFSGSIGTHKAFIFASLLFLIGSFISGASNSIQLLIVGRILQSIGAAVVLPLGMAIAYSTAETVEEREPIVAVVALTQGLAAALGPSLGGALTQYFSWRWAFFINIPIVIFIVAISLMTLEIKNEPVNSQKNDLVGSILSMFGLFSLVLALIQGSSWGWTSFNIIALFTFALLDLLFFIWYERRIDYPMIPMELFSFRNFNAASLVMIISTVFQVGIFIVLPTYYSKILGHSVVSSSVLLMAVSLTLTICSPVASMALRKVGPRITMFTGFILMGVAYALFGTITESSNIQLYIACLFLGAGYGLLLGPSQVLGASDFKGSLLTASQSVIFVFRQVGLVLAFAIFLSLFNSHIEQIGTTYTKITAFTSIYKTAVIIVFASSLLSLLFKRKIK